MPPPVDLHEQYWIGKVDNYFVGTIDEVGFYDYVLSAADVMSKVPTSCAADTGSAGCCGETGGDGVSLENGCTADASACVHDLVYKVREPPKLVQKSGQLQPFIAVLPQECTGQPAFFWVHLTPFSPQGCFLDDADRDLQAENYVIDSEVSWDVGTRHYWPI